VSGEIIPERLVETLMTIALEHAGADRGVLFLFRNDALRIEAVAEAGPRSIKVDLREAAITSGEHPESLLQTVTRTRETVILDDAHRPNPFSQDAYLQRRRPRSVLCLPLIKQAQLVGMLYLENGLAPGTFTPQRTAVLQLLASQAAISLENARLYAELIDENSERRKVEEALRASEATLAQAQQISHTGSWRWNIRRGAFGASAELFRILDLHPATGPLSYSDFIQRAHPEDRPRLEQVLDNALRGKGAFRHEYRIVLSDSSMKHLQCVGQPDAKSSGDLEFVGTIMDITERKRADEALRTAQAELAHVTRVMTLGELAASIAHEVNQPLAAIVANGDAGLRWLDRNPPDLARVRASLESMISDGMRAGEVVRRIRGLARKTGPQKALVDFNACIQEVVSLVQHEVATHRVSLQLEFAPQLPPVLGDKVQLQQVIINLIINGIEAMASVTNRQRRLVIGTCEQGAHVLVAVQDCGAGIDPESETRVFQAFFTTKPDGVGMGLSICRSIIEAHGGRLWVSSRAEIGTTFQFTLPSHREGVS
jgi:signal transduction histidine kinase